jgi:hypothetical protein
MNANSVFQYLPDMNVLLQSHLCFPESDHIVGLNEIYILYHEHNFCTMSSTNQN